MALPNGDLITTVFDPQMAYPVDKRMQVDTLNSRDSMSMFVRWEGMEVYVLENSKKYILQGGRSNEYWKETGTGTGTGGTTFVGQFESDDLLPTAGRSAGDYAFVGTGEDFVQYNWDNISNQWVMAEGQTDMASEFFHIGYKTPLRRPVIFPLFPKDVLVQESGDFVFAPETAVARFIFVGEVDAIRGIETAAADMEIKLVNRTGSDIPLRDKASGISSGSGFDFGGTDYTWVNGSEITLKGNGTYWELAPNNQIAFSDHLDSVNAQASVGSDGLKVWSGFIDAITKVPVNFKQLDYIPSVVDGRIFRQINGEYFGDAEFLETGIFNVIKFGADPTGLAFSDVALDRIRMLMRDGDKIVFPHGTYRFQNTQTFTKSVDIDFGGSTITCSERDGFVFTGLEKSTHSVTVDYTEGWGNNYLTLNSVIGIEKGDIINIISTELYDTSRSYHYKGGNFLVTNVVGDVVFFDRAMPFNMSAGSITVKIYKPIKVKLRNIGKLKSTQNLTNTLYGLRLLYVAESSIDNVETDNFKYNIDVYRSVGVTISDTTTGLAKRNDDNFDGYGIALECSTRITLNNVVTESGQHGVTTGGREVCYDFTFNDCLFKSEIPDWPGFGAHANLYNATFNSNVFFGFLGAGNCIINGGSIYSYTQVDKAANLLVSDHPIYSSFTFNSVDITGYLSLRDQAQIMTATRKHTRSLIFNNCPKVHIRLNISLFTSTGKIGELGTLEVNNSDDLKIYQSDNIGTLIIRDCKKTKTDRAITPAVVGGRVPRINTAKIDNLTLHGNTYAIGFKLQNVGQLELNNIILPVGDSPSAIPFELQDIESVTLKNTDTSAVERPISVSGNVGSMIVENSKISFRNATEFNTFVNSAQNFTSRKLRSTLDGLIYDINTGDTLTPSIKYKKEGIDEYYLTSGNSWQAIYREKPRLLINTNSVSLALTHASSYLALGGSSGFVVINSNIFVPGTPRQYLSVEGEVEGGDKTFTAGEGVILRYPEGQGLTAPTGSRFIIKFKSPNDALVTIIKPYTTTEILSATATLDFPIIAAGESAQLTSTVTGAAELDPVEVGAPSAIYNSNGADVVGWASGPNQVTVRVRNNGASSIDPVEGQFKIKVFK